VSSEKTITTDDKQKEKEWRKKIKQADEELRECETKENEFIIVANGFIYHIVKFAESVDFEMNTVQGMRLKFQSYFMNIQAAQLIDEFLYCLCKSHIKTIDEVPMHNCEAGVYVYGVSQMHK
jgi:hypothetical protein